MSRHVHQDSCVTSLMLTKLIMMCVRHQLTAQGRRLLWLDHSPLVYAPHRAKFISCPLRGEDRLLQPEVTNRVTQVGEAKRRCIKTTRQLICPRFQLPRALHSRYLFILFIELFN